MVSDNNHLPVLLRVPGILHTFPSVMEVVIQSPLIQYQSFFRFQKTLIEGPRPLIIIAYSLV